MDHLEIHAYWITPLPYSRLSKGFLLVGCTKSNTILLAIQDNSLSKILSLSLQNIPT